MIANKNAITTRATVVINKRDDLAVGVGVSVEVEDDGAGVVLKGVFAGMVTVCMSLQPLVSPTSVEIWV